MKMKIKIATLQLLIGMVLCSCATKYHPPDATQVVETTKKVKAGIRKASENAKVVSETIKKAQESTDKITILSTDISGRLEEIIKIAPPELKPPLALLQTDVNDIKTEEASLSSFLISAYTKQSEQEKTLTETQAHEIELEGHQQVYQDRAQKLADVATKQSTKLAWYQWHWWGSWIALGIGVLACLAFVVLKFFIKL